MALHLYTSYYKKMMSYPKEKERDLFIQVSRTCPFWFVKDGKSLVDENMGEALGNFSEDLDDYYSQLEANHDVWNDWATELKSEMQEAEKTDGEYNIFLLCYENIEKKPCHRRIIAKYFEEKFDISIPEWQG
jgi:hypothetical protein